MLVVDQDGVERGMVRDERRRGRRHDDRDIRRWKAPTEGTEERRRQHDVAEEAALDDEDALAHRRALERGRSLLESRPLREGRGPRDAATLRRMADVR